MRIVIEDSPRIMDTMCDDAVVGMAQTLRAHLIYFGLTGMVEQPVVDQAVSIIAGFIGDARKEERQRRSRMTRAEFEQEPYTPYGKPDPDRYPDVVAILEAGNKSGVQGAVDQYEMGRDGRWLGRAYDEVVRAETPSPKIPGKSYSTTAFLGGSSVAMTGTRLEDKYGKKSYAGVSRLRRLQDVGFGTIIDIPMFATRVAMSNKKAIAGLSAVGCFVFAVGPLHAAAAFAGTAAVGILAGGSAFVDGYNRITVLNNCADGQRRGARESDFEAWIGKVTTCADEANDRAIAGADTRWNREENTHYLTGPARDAADGLFKSYHEQSMLAEEWAEENPQTVTVTLYTLGAAALAAGTFTLCNAYSSAKCRSYIKMHDPDNDLIAKRFKKVKSDIRLLERILAQRTNPYDWMPTALTRLKQALEGAGVPPSNGLISNLKGHFQDASQGNNPRGAFNLDQDIANQVSAEVKRFLDVEKLLAYQFLIKPYRESLDELTRHKEEWRTAFGEWEKVDKAARVVNGGIPNSDPKVKDCALFGQRIWAMLESRGRPPTPAELAPFPYKAKGKLTRAEKKERAMGLLSIVEQLPGILTSLVSKWAANNYVHGAWVGSDDANRFDSWMVLEPGQRDAAGNLVLDAAGNPRVPPDPRLADYPADENPRWKEFYQSVCATCSLEGGGIRVAGGAPPDPILNPPPDPVTTLPVLAPHGVPDASPKTLSLASEPYCGEIERNVKEPDPFWMVGRRPYFDLAGRGEAHDDRCHEDYEALANNPPAVAAERATIVDQVLAELAAARLR